RYFLVNSSKCDSNSAREKFSRILRMVMVLFFIFSVSFSYSTNISLILCCSIYFSIKPLEIIGKFKEGSVVAITLKYKVVWSNFKSPSIIQPIASLYDALYTPENILNRLDTTQSPVLISSLEITYKCCGVKNGE